MTTKKKPARKAVKAKRKSKPKPKPKTEAKSKTSYHHRMHVTEGELTDHLHEDLRDAWQKLRDFGVSLNTPRIYASHNSIMFSRKYCYFFVRPKKTFLEVWIFLPRKIDGLKAMQSSKKSVKYCNLFKLIHADQVEEPLTDWIREAFAYTQPLDPA
jgi:hypothetical protein